MPLNCLGHFDQLKFLQILLWEDLHPGSCAQTHESNYVYAPYLALEVPSGGPKNVHYYLWIIGVPGS